MDWSDSPEQAAFRAEVRAFNSTRLPARYREPFAEITPHDIPGPNGETLRMFGANWEPDRLSADPAVRQAAADWADALAERGWIAAAWPKEFGGAGFTPLEQFIFIEERMVSGAPRVGGPGAMFLGSVLMVHGTAEQQAKFMPQIARGKIEWGQGYSEPGAGSDLASLSLRAIRDGDEFVLNGQKIWSTPQTADAMFLLVRTDPDAPKHRGISFLMVEDFKAPGIHKKPLMNMAWEYSSFGETFFEDVRVPATHLIGEENRGWYVAMTLMDFDRGSISNPGEEKKSFEDLMGEVRTPGSAAQVRVSELPAVRAELAECFVKLDLAKTLAVRVAWMQSSGLIPNYEASIAKLFSSELRQQVSRAGIRALGLYANLWPGEPRAPLRGMYSDLYIRTIPRTIAGGSSEIQRNVIATRGLGLPRG